MTRKILMALAASAAIAIAQLPTDATAKSFSHSSGATILHSSGKSFTASSAIRSSSTGGVNFARSGSWSGGHRFHRFRNRAFVGAPFAYAAYDSCYRWRHVWTHWGWRLRRVYVCDYPYVY
jgi:hypothetical protein